MPDKEKKEKWNPKNLYQTPEFPENEGTTEIYGQEPEKRGKWYIYAVVLAAALAVTFCALILTGVLKLPSLGSLLGGGTGSGLTQSIYPPNGMPVVSEIMASGKAANAPDGKTYDWIELYNPTDHAIDLTGFGLSDNPDKPAKFVLPARSLGSGECVVIFASGKQSKDNEIHASFKLKASGAILFTDPRGGQIQRIDYPKMPEDNSLALNLSDMARWEVTDKPTQGERNN